MDLSFLEPVYGSGAPVASVYLDVSRDSEDAEHAIQVRWGKAREDLAGQGADEALLGALDPVIGRSEGAPGPCGQVAVAADGTVLFDILVARPPQDYGASVGHLPDPMPYLLRRGQHVPYVLAVVDSVGADLSAVYASGRRRAERVEGGDDPLHKPRGGAYHHKQMQRSVDEQVTQNVKRIVEAIGRLAVRGGAERVVIAGEAPVRRQVHERLPDGVGAMAVEAEAGSRAAGSGGAPLDTELEGILRDRAEEQVREVANAFEEGRGNDDRVVEGLAPVVYALQRGQVRTLLWSPGTAVNNVGLWIGPSGQQLALSRQELTDIDVAEPVREAVEPALVRAAVTTSADLVFVSPDEVELDEGLGALLRFPDPTLPA